MFFISCTLIYLWCACAVILVVDRLVERSFPVMSANGGAAPAPFFKAPFSALAGAIYATLILNVALRLSTYMVAA